MAISTVTLYKVGFRPETNPCLDSIATYLASLTPVLTINNFQFVKHALDLTIKCEIYQDELSSPSMNYLSIKNDIDSRTYYYYIRNVYWRSQNTLLLDLSMDTLNTFKDLIVFNDHTLIKREHRDRFIKPATVPTTSFTAIRDIDISDEGLTGLVKYVSLKTNIQPYMKKWYLVYCNNQGLNVGDTSSNDAINCYLVPESDEVVSTGATVYTGFDVVNTTMTYRIFTSDSVTININGTSYTNTSSKHYGFGRYSTDTSGFVCYIEGNTVNRVAININLANNIIFSAITGATGLLTTDGSSTIYLPTYDILNKNYATFNAYGSYTIKSIANVNRTLSYLVKIIECPYPPVNITTAISNGDLSVTFTTELNSAGMYALKLAKLETEFNNLIYNAYTLGEFACTIPSEADRATADKNIIYESKIYHSSIFSRVLTYDSFTLEIPYEEFSGTESACPSVDIYYKQSNAINSALYFNLEVDTGKWTPTGALEHILMCDRNNEYPIYNSSYLDYIRTGYNFNKKAKNLQSSQMWTNAGLNLIGSLASFGLSSATKGISAVSGVSLLTSGISSISNAIYSDINLRNQIEQKKAEAKVTASSVETSDDLNLLNGYLGNKLFSFTYVPKGFVWYKVFDLFYLTGYARERTGVPNTTSRKRFNYLECDPEFTTRDNPAWKNFIEDVKERFKLGVTFFHTYDDFLQEKENWEVWL